MASVDRVVWSEGMFLRTQHFQQQDRHTAHIVRDSLRAQPLPQYGFERLEIDANALAAGRFSLKDASGLFADGTYFSLAQNARVPEGIALDAGADAGVVYLALPEERANGVTMERAHHDAQGARFRGEEVEVRDTVRDGAEPELIETARLAPRLIGPNGDLSGYTALPVARVVGRDTSGAILLDEDFLPPALRMGALIWYAEFAREVATGLERIAEAHGQMVIDGTGASTENLLILEMANTARPRIEHLLAQNDSHPSVVFLELASLCGKMATYASAARRETEPLPVYDHLDPQSGFGPLAEDLRARLQSLRYPITKSRSLTVAKHADNIWTVRVDNPELVRASRIVLRIGSQMSDKVLRQLFVEQTTVGAAEEFEKLWTVRMPGIPLLPLHTQPREIPYDGDRLCLELDRKSEHWEHLMGSQGFVIGVSGNLERDPEIDCYAINR